MKLTTTVKKLSEEQLDILEWALNFMKAYEKRIERKNNDKQ